jgi:hypothetical protein
LIRFTDGTAGLVQTLQHSVRDAHERCYLGDPGRGRSTGALFAPDPQHNEERR